MSSARRTAAGSLIALILTVTGCVGRETPSSLPPRATTPPASSASLSRKWVRHLPAGWGLIREPVSATGAGLADVLATDTSYFQDYGLAEVTSLACARDAQSPVLIEVFTFPDSTRAFGAWSGRRPSGAESVGDLGDGAFRSPHALHVWKGIWYVRLAGQPAGGDDLVALASSLATGMATAGGRPPELDLLARSARMPGSESLSVRDGFGQPFLAGSFTASFLDNNAAYEGLVLRAAGRRAAIEALDGYRTLYGVHGKLLDPIPGLGEESFSGEDALLGRTVAFRRGRWLVAYRGIVPLSPLVGAALESDAAVRWRESGAASPAHRE